MSDNVTVLPNSSRSKTVTKQNFTYTARTGKYTPYNALTFYKILEGDKSDNIPGVFGVGEKTALKLLSEYQTLDGIYENIDKISGQKLKEKLANDKEMAFLSYKLATIACDMPLPFTPQEYTIEPDAAKLRAFCDENELKSVWTSLNRLYNDEQPTESGSITDLCHYITADSVIAEKLIAQIKDSGYFAYLPIISGKVPHVIYQGLMIESNDKNASQSIYIPNQPEFEKYINDCRLHLRLSGCATL